ncbi:WXG100 family type VII secretion target [Nocardia donostiensis]|uniref:Outer membrane channel protein CpnT-like N-terminal domain-containing protein n=1 Tax=Nocardia donostiensis TaxID=1538463 RepID=A0A1W0BL16_9NOCA|nr:WXG100 family type VII secretion target [Nocardia donostiensis]ONM48570.1 hypothetical protein B0T46_10940 [Nocardia donostiensis]OQS16761.1 hypothetical protein B0T36_03625 [Nocardia donostiensis]OQS23224.1 hypothetical protein B0T44_02940 [Nocardia donostiensis]
MADTQIGDWLNRNLPGFDDAPPPENDHIVEGTDYREEYFQETVFSFSNVGLERKDDGPWGVLKGTIAGDTWQIVTDLTQGSFSDAALGARGVVDTVKSVRIDPFGFLGTQIVGWLLEHVEPYRRTLDALYGSPDMVEAYAATWQKIAEELVAVSSDWQSAIDRELAEWGGQAAQAYRNRAAAITDHITAAGGVAQALSTMMEKIAKVVEAYRTLVQDVLTSLAGALVGFSIAWALSSGAATPLVVSGALARIAADGARISLLVKNLKSALLDLLPYTKALNTIVQALVTPSEPQQAPA